jgi:hypothetical protein
MDLQADINVSKEHTVSIFRPEDEGSMFLSGVLLEVRMTVKPTRPT